MATNVFTVDSGSTEWSDFPQVATFPDGRFVVTWMNEAGVYVRYYDAAGQPLGAEILVASLGGNVGSRFESHLTVLSNGNVAVVWNHTILDESRFIVGTSVGGRLLGPTGQVLGNIAIPAAPQGATEVTYDAPAVAALADGGFVLSWHYSERVNLVVQSGIRYQVFNSSGGAVGATRTIPGGVIDSDVAGLEGGGFVIAWRPNEGGRPLFSQRFNAEGAAVSAPIKHTDDSWRFDVTGLKNGGYALTWGGWMTEDVYASVVSAQGSSPPVLVSAGTAGRQESPFITGTTNGGFLVSWLQADSTGRAILGQRFTATGAKEGGEFVITTDFADGAALAALPGNGFVALWDVNSWNSTNFIRGGLNKGVQPLFSVGADTVDFNNLTLDQKAAIDAGANLYEALSGNDVVTLPDTENDDLRPGITWDYERAFNGGLGDDKITGGNGEDEIGGGSGTNHLYGMAGVDFLVGGPEKDFIYGGDDPDTLWGGAGDDYLEGNDGGDIVYGDAFFFNGTSMDTLIGGAGNDFLYGGGGKDTLWGEADRDTIKGDGGDDTITGGSEADWLYGGENNDTIHSGTLGGIDLGGNELFGEGGKDTLNAMLSLEGALPDKLTGGSGHDTFFVDVRAGAADRIRDFEVGESAHTLLLGDPKSYAILATTEGTKVSIFNQSGAVAGRFMFDTRISPAELRVSVEVVDEGEYLTVTRSLNPDAAIRAAMQELTPFLNVLVAHVYDGLKSRFGDLANETIAKEAIHFLGRGFATNQKVATITNALIDKIRDGLPELTDDALEKISDSLVDKLGAFVIEEVMEAIESKQAPQVLTNDTYDFIKLFVEPILVAVPGGTALVRISDGLNKAFLVGLEIISAAEWAAIAAETPDLGTGAVTINTPTGKTSWASEPEDITSAMGSEGHDTVYTDEPVEELPEPIEDVHQMDEEEPEAEAEQGLALLSVAVEPAPSRLGGNSLNNRLTGNNSDNHILGRAGDDVLIGRGGNDLLDGGAGDDTAVFGFAVGEYTIMQSGAAIRIAHKSTSAGEGTDTVTGVENFWFGSSRLSLAEVRALAVNAPYASSRLVLGAGASIEVGDFARVIGTTTNAETVSALQGRVEFDASFNSGGDRIVLPGLADTYTGSRSGSVVILTSEQITVRIPVGVNGLTVQFADAVRTLLFDQQQGAILLGAQKIELSSTGILPGSGDFVAEPLPAGSGAISQLVFATGQSMSVGGNLRILGTAVGAETVTVDHGTVTFDASFNQGGDTVMLPGNTENYSVRRSGSTAIIEGDGLSVTIPVGPAGLSVEFADATRILRFDTQLGAVVLGDQVVTTSKLPVTAAAAIGSAQTSMAMLAHEEMETDGRDFSGPHRTTTGEPLGSVLLEDFAGLNGMEFADSFYVG